MPVLIITPPSDKTKGETAFFLMNFINRQLIAPELEAVSRRGEVRIEAPDEISDDTNARVVAEYVKETEKDGAQDQIDEARELAENLSAFLTWENADPAQE